MIFLYDLIKMMIGRTRVRFDDETPSAALQDVPAYNTGIRLEPPLSGRRMWMLTIPRTEEFYMEESILFQKLKNLCEKFNFQLEEGENTQYLHWQVAMLYLRKKRFNQIQNDWPGIHVSWGEPNWGKIVNYCTKKDTRVRGPWNEKSIFIKDPLAGMTLYRWQQEVKDLIELRPNNRHIYWYWNAKGGEGKTSLAKSLCINHPGTLYLSGKAADMKYAVAKYIEHDIPKVIIFDYCRSVEEYVSYEGLESIKNGIFFSSKYESNMTMFDTPHVICFANFEPDRKKLSEDRWMIRKI